MANRKIILPQYGTVKSVRQSLLQEKWIRKLPMKEYAEEAYEKAVRETPCCTEDSPVEKRRREIAYLNLKWFMATLLDRMERTSTWYGLSARVPIADYRIIEYVWNVPWSVKCEDGIPKALFRRAGKGKVPDEVLWRKDTGYQPSGHRGTDVGSHDHSHRLGKIHDPCIYKSDYHHCRSG